jgi:hypothetical protein
MSIKARTQYLSVNAHMAACLAAHFRGSPGSWRDVAADIELLTSGARALLPRVYRDVHLHRQEGLDFREDEAPLPLAQWRDARPSEPTEQQVVATGEYLLRILLRNYLLADTKAMLALAKDGYRNAGRGALVTGVSQIAEDFKGKLDVFYVPAAKLFEHFGVPAGEQRERLQAQLDAYDPEKEVLVWAQNLGGSLTHFKLA